MSTKVSARAIHAAKPTLEPSEQTKLPVQAKGDAIPTGPVPAQELTPYQRAQQILQRRANRGTAPIEPPPVVGGSTEDGFLVDFSGVDLDMEQDSSTASCTAKPKGSSRRKSKNSEQASDTPQSMESAPAP